MRKLLIYTSYLYEYLKHADWVSLYSAIRYVVQGKTYSKDRIITTDLGRFFVRGGTNDIQYANPQYEREIKHISKVLIQSGYTMVLDIGACMGEYSIFCAKLGAKVIAFEPIENNFKALQKNTELNQVNVSLIPLGLGAKKEHSVLNFNPVNTGASGWEEFPENPVEVDFNTLDAYLPQLETHHVLVKIDAEGMEIEILNGGEQFFSNTKKLSVILEDKFIDKSLLKSTLDRLMNNYKVERIDEFNILITKE